MSFNSNFNFIKENYLLILAILYIISPIDIIPDILPIAGYGDDLFVLIMTLVYKYYIHKKATRPNK